MASELIDEPPALMFDEIKGYPKGFRVLSIPAGSRVRMCIALGLPTDTPKMEIVRHAAQRIKNAPPIPPKEVATGPVMENIMRDNEVDLLEKAAASIEEGPVARHGGRRAEGTSVYVRDPDGNLLEFMIYG